MAACASVLVVAGCSSSDGTDTEPTPSDTAPLTPDECIEAARSAVVPLQEFIDRYGELTAAEWNALDPVPDIAPLEEGLVEELQAIVDEGCEPGLVDVAVADELAQLTGSGEVGLALAAVLRGDRSPLGPPSPVPASTTPRGEAPTTVAVGPEDDLSAVLATLAPGSRLELEPGIYEFDQPLVIDVGVEIVGAGRDETVIRSTATDNAVAFLGPGELTIRGLTMEHVGDAPAAVLVSIVGSLFLQDVKVTGGQLSEDGQSGGHGVVLAFESIDGIPDRSDEQLEGEVVVEDSELTANAGGGILITGEASPRIERTVVTENGRCGICYTGSSAGSVTSSRVERNDIGLQIADTASPVIDGNEIAANRTAGAIVLGESAPTFRDNTFTEDLEIGIQVLDSALPLIENNVIVAPGTVGIAFADDSAGEAVGNDVQRAGTAGFLVGGSASPSLRENTLTDNVVGLVHTDDSAGEAVGNTIRGHELGVQVTGTARPEILGNVIEDSGDAGALYAGSATGRFEANTVSGSGSFGVQVGETAAPAVIGNVFTAIEVASILFVDTSTGEVSGNECSGGAGIGIAPTASPEVGTNNCVVSETG